MKENSKEVSEKIERLVDEVFLILKNEDSLSLCDAVIMSAWLSLIVNNYDKEDALRKVDVAFKEIRKMIKDFPRDKDE